MPKALRAWPTERIHRLVTLWPDPTKTIADIARELGVDRSTVVLRAEYLALPGRAASHRNAETHRQ
jgi:hypothetical protein